MCFSQQTPKKRQTATITRNLIRSRLHRRNPTDGGKTVVVTARDQRAAAVAGMIDTERGTVPVVGNLETENAAGIETKIG